MKKSAALLSANLVLLSMINTNNVINCSPKKTIKNISSSNTTIKKAKLAKYKDGTYNVKTNPDGEGYYCKAKVVIKNNKIASVDWHIYDSENRIFDEKYEKVFDNQEYKQQCRSDLKGAKTYAAALVKKQDIEKVDAVSGATWTNGLFKTVMRVALEKAKI